MDTNRETVRVILLGTCGAGKSAFGNAILDEEAFESKKSLRSRSVTQSLDYRTLRYGDKTIEIIDTPSFNEIRGSEIFMKDFQIGYDVIVVVVPLQRMTNEMSQAFEAIIQDCGLVPRDPVVVVYTFGDETEDTVDEFLKDSNSTVLETVHSLCNGRYISINNTSNTDREVKRKFFLDMVVKATEANNNKRLVKKRKLTNYKAMRILITPKQVLIILFAFITSVVYFLFDLANRVIRRIVSVILLFLYII